MRTDIIIISEWVECLARLRDARTLILRDGEAFHEACTALERIGQILCGKLHNGLSKYQAVLLDLANLTGRHDPTEVDRLLNGVREARNMAVHEGAWARNLSTRLIDMFLILEEAIMTKMTRAEDVMVRNPTVAETWNFVAHARQSLLANSFTYLPILLDGEWRTVSDMSFVRYLRAAENPADRKSRLSTRIDSAIKAGAIVASEPNCCSPKETLDQVTRKLETGPVLVTEAIDGSPRLLGIITPFDLL